MTPQEIIDKMVWYIQTNNLKSLVIGISGGIDSALTAALMKSACEECSIPLIGVWLGLPGNKSNERDRAFEVLRDFCHKAVIIDEDEFKNCYTKMWSTIGYACLDEKERRLELSAGAESSKTKIRQGNVKARLRMIALYDIAKANNGIVLSTDNLTEYYLGFWTLHGDVGDVAPIQHLWKTDVYKMARKIIEKPEACGLTISEAQKNTLRECIEAVPTDGLGITESDLDQLGVDSYEEADEILKFIIDCKGKTLPRIIREHPITSRYKATEFKREQVRI